ncbi:MAG: Tol-Pal system beta propeller repeat protein TolB [Candidatus Hydrogenedentes bacterium]|nr:Tol-Pal system beta propeller repeat protein TolB [Candidatus Hydrogenedentota bacterium]
MKTRRLLTVVAAAAAALLGGMAHAQQPVLVDITKGVDARIPIAVPPFATQDPGLAAVAEDVARVVADDLTFSGVFTVLPRDVYPVSFTGFTADLKSINFPEWQATRAENLVYGLIFQEGSQIVGQFRLFDLKSFNQVYGQEVRVDAKNARLAGHRFSEEVVRYLDGVAGGATSEMVFSVTAGETKEIYVADYDGANARKITDHKSLSIKPKISPDGNRIAYVSYKDRYSYLYVLDRRTGKSTPLSKEVGLNSAPCWSPDGSRLAITLSKDGNTEIYLRNPDGSNPVRLTRNTQGDTSPTFSPDGSKIAFVSDRVGRPQIYVMDSNGGNQTRLSFHGGSAFDPVWSPDGKMVAFVSEVRGEGMEIYVMGADGANPTKLTDSQGINESPSWSPDSRHVVFSSNRTGRSEVYAVNVKTGEEMRMSRFPVPAEGPSWGPRRR